MTLLERLCSLTDIHGDIIPFHNMPKELYIIIHDDGTLTGSRAFGVANKDSDYDVIIPPGIVSFDTIIYSYNGLYLRENINAGIAPYIGEDFDSCYVRYNTTKIYNLLIMHHRLAYQKWIYATEYMKNTAELSWEYRKKLRDKEFRVAEFEWFKEEYERLYNS